MKLYLTQHSVEIPCPKCGKELKEKIGRLYRDHYITCPVCGPVTVDTDQLRRLEDAINKELAKIPKKITLKF